MEKQEIIKQVKFIMKDVFDLEQVSISESTTAADIEEWDSLNHIQLVVGIEKHFSIRFTSKEIQSWKNVGEMIDIIASKK